MTNKESLLRRAGGGARHTGTRLVFRLEIPDHLAQQVGQVVVCVAALVLNDLVSAVLEDLPQVELDVGLTVFLSADQRSQLFGFLGGLGARILDCLLDASDFLAVTLFSLLELRAQT